MLYGGSKHDLLSKTVDGNQFIVGDANTVFPSGQPFNESRTQAYFGSGGSNSGSDHGSSVLSTVTTVGERRLRDWMAWDRGSNPSGADRGLLVFPPGMLVVDFAGEGNTREDGQVCTDALMAAESRASSYCDADVWHNDISGAGGLHKKGIGKLSLQGAGTSTFAGGVLLEGGELEILADANLGAATSTLSFAGGTLVVSGTIPASRNIMVASGSFASFNVESAAVVSGTISGAGGLEKSGDGMLLLDGSSDYTGTTRVLAGSLTGSGIPTGGDLYVAISATVDFSNAFLEVGTLGEDFTGEARSES